MRLRFLHPKPGTEPLAARQRATAPVGEGAVAAARVRARRRLVGALVLLAIGVIGFPVLFETQPRPLPLDTPIETPAREMAGTPQRAAPPPKSAPLPTVPADAGTEMASASAAPTPTPAASVPATAPATASPAVVASVPVLQSAPASRASAPAVAAARPPLSPPAPMPASAPPKPPPAVAAVPALAAGAGRYVVQVGAYSDPATLREARARVEKLDLKTYTQVIEGEGKPRTRVRVGPYATRDEADAAAAKLKRANLPANVLAL